MFIRPTLAFLLVFGVMLNVTLSAQCNDQEASTKLISKAKTPLSLVETAIADGRFKTLVAAVGAAELVETLQGKGPFTLFAPTDSAFEKLPKGAISTLLKPEMKNRLTSILTWHVVPGTNLATEVSKIGFLPTVNGQRLPITISEDSVRVAGAKVIITDIKCSNGVIHVIDTVMMPASQNIAEVAKAAGTFGTLLTAATKAGLLPALTGAGPLTIFAPTDAAFAALPKGTVESLLKPANKSKLVAILKYHIVSGRLYSPRLLKKGKAKTLQGRSLQIKLANGKAFANQATLLNTDIESTNGVIHVVDQVLIP